MDPVLGTALTVFGVLASAYLTYRVSNRKLRTDGAQQMIDQLQEEMKEMRAERATERAKDSARIDALERTQRIQGDYIGKLRRHIADGDPPPPPPYPDGLIT